MSSLEWTLARIGGKPFTSSSRWWGGSQTATDIRHRLSARTRRISQVFIGAKGDCSVLARTRAYFATDLHGSDACFRKFVNAGKFYDANVLLLAGDITENLIVPIVRKPDGTYGCNYTGTELILESQEKVDRIAKTLRDSGYYPHLAEPDEVEELSVKQELAKQLFLRLATERVQGWMQVLEEVLKGTEIKCYISFGDQDLRELESSFNSPYTVNPEGKVINVDGEHEMITIGSVNQADGENTKSVEEGWRSRIESEVSRVKDAKKSIFNLHIPPRNTVIDRALRRDEKQRLVVAGCHPVTISEGSSAVRAAIERYRPLVGIHGHFDESRGIAKVGRTMCFNPGSEYNSGILRGLLCELEADRIKSYVLTSG